MQAEQHARGLATVKEAAGYLGLRVAKVYLLMAGGELPFVKFGKSRRIAWSALEEPVQRRTHNGTGCEPSRN
jgi:excisionase family DNA binding protein